MMRFHVVGLPNTQTNGLFPMCAYTNKIIGFSKMMQSLGHKVFLYSGEHNIAECHEHIECMTEERRAQAVGETYLAWDWNTLHPHRRDFHIRAIKAITERFQEGDFILTIGGPTTRMFLEFFKSNHVVEWAVGYSDCAAHFRIFESYAWMHANYGAWAGNASKIDGKFFDAVVPGYIDLDEVEPNFGEREDHVLFVGRLIDRKGLQVAIEATERSSHRLVVVGQGDYVTEKKHVEFVGPLSRQDTLARMANARALICPTIYCEPFGNVAVEAMAHGTPVISTDWGAFTETVAHDITGYRCRTLAEFASAIELAPLIDPRTCAAIARASYSTEVIKLKFHDHFERLATLLGKGWYA